MLNKPYKILVIDDDEEDFFIIKEYLRDFSENDYRIDWIASYSEGKQAIKAGRYDIYLIDHLLGAGTGLEMIEEAIKDGCLAPLILLTGFGDIELDRKAIRSGAADYLPKAQLNPEMLERTIRHSLERYEQFQLFHHQQARFQSLFEQSVDAIYIVEKDWTFVQVNQSFMEMFHVHPEDLQYLTLDKLFQSKHESEDFRKRIEMRGSVRNHPIEFTKEDGSVRQALLSCAPILGLQQEITGYQGVIRDITQFRKAEKEIEVAERFNMSGRLARIIAHEIRNPLTTISLATEQFADELDGMSESLNTYLDMIRRSNERISTLIDELLNSTRTPELILSENEIEPILDEALKTCVDRLKLKNISIVRKKCEQSLSATVDREKIQIVFVNIITNAIEAMDGVEKPELTVRCAPHGDACVVAISDNGKGMDKNTLDRLFDPFFTGRQGGMGLGMTAVQNIVSQHSGTINVTSKPGEGTTFQIILNREAGKIAFE